MRTKSRTVTFVLALAVASACEAGDEVESGEAAGPDGLTEQPDPSVPQTGAQVEDGLPVRPIMQTMSTDVAGLLSALWFEDYPEVAARADAIADHAPLSPDERDRIQAELGPEMEAFQELDEAVHLAAVRVREAAEAERVDELLDGLSEMQRGCVSCHTRFREVLSTRTP